MLTRTLRLSLALLAATVVVEITPAQIGWTQWPASAGGNDHWYLAVHSPGGIDWTTARQRAQQLGGDLASITSAAENTFVFGLVSDPVFWRVVPNPTRMFGPWLGGFQPAGSGEPLGSWSWVSGEAWSYQNWSPNEPNNYQGMQEDHLHFFSYDLTPRRRWNDLMLTKLTPGFVVEATTPPIAAYVELGVGSSTDGGTPPWLLPLSAQDLPRIGTVSRLRLIGYPSNTLLGFMAIGFSNRYFGTSTAKLPIDLFPIGWAGCKLLVSSDALVAFPVTTVIVDHHVGIPADPNLIGAGLFFQGVCLTPTATLMSQSVAGYVGP